MNVYIGDIATAAAAFPLVAALLTLPYLIYQYRKLGSVPWISTLVIYSFVFYMLCAYFLVLLPLPADRSAIVPYAQTPQLIPFNFLREFAEETPFSATDPSTWIASLTTPCVYEAIFNLALLLPLGVYLRYYFQRKWWQALIISFLVTLSFELTQLTGIWGIYSHPYRLFDVDDLIINTFGAMLGFWLAGPMLRVLPDLDAITAEAKVKGLRASATRRALSFGIDVAIVVAGTIIASSFVDFYIAAAIFIVAIFFVVPIATRGKTPGQAIFKLRIVRPDAQAASWIRIIARYGLLLCLMALPPVIFVLTANTVVSDIFADKSSAASDFIASYTWEFAIAYSVFLALWALTLIIRAAISLKRKAAFVMLNGLISGTRVMSDSGILQARET